MSFFAILLALLLEQARPLGQGNPVHATMRGWMRWVLRSFDAGHAPHGWLVWSLAVGAPALVALAVHWLLLAWLGWFAAALWSVAILYVTLGFRQFSHFFTDIRDALAVDNEERAREILGRWMQIDARGLPRREIVRNVIEQSVLAAHRHVFGVLAWFSVLAAFGFGPLGAVLYRLAEFLPRYCARLLGEGVQPVSEAARESARQAWHLVDWVPARITALCFAVVGSFEDAIESWRNYKAQFGAHNDGLIVAATAGAIGVRLGPDVVAPPPGESENIVAPARIEPEPGHLRSIVGLVWRSVVMWLLLLFLLTLARLLG